MPYPDTPVTGDLEAGWRIAQPFWGKGVAFEAARAAIDWGWANTDGPRVIAYTIGANTHSWGLMERLGMNRRADLDFHHPRFAAEDLLGAMLVWAVERPRTLSRNQARPTRHGTARSDAIARGK